MKSTIKNLWMLISLLCNYFSASAYNFEVDGIYYNNISMITCSVAGYNKNYNPEKLREITIPSEIVNGGYTCKVISIESRAFEECEYLTAINLPETITNIGSFAFSWCENLLSVKLPDSLNIISDGCFWCCTSLKSLSIPDNVTWLGESAFLKCTELSSINLPKGINHIGRRCFEDCYNLSEFDTPDSITVLPEKCFMYCKNLRHIKIPKTITRIDANCFESSGLTSIDIPETAIVGQLCFSNCKQLKKATIKARYIGKGCFCGCVLEYLYLGCNPSYNEFNAEGINTDTLVISSKIKYLNLGIHVFPQSHATPYYACLLVDTPTKIVFEDSVDTLQIVWGYDDSDTYNKSDNIHYRNFASTFHWGSDSWGADTKEIYLGRPLQGCEMDTRGVEVLTLGPQLRKFGLGSEIKSISQLPSLKQLNSLNPTPPIIGNPTETQYENVKVTVPAEFLSEYQNDPIWKGFWNITGIADLDEDIEIDKQYKVYTSGGSICVEADSSDTVEIYTLQGIAVYSGKGSIRHEVPGGVYIVRVNGHATKLLVR